MMMEQQQANGIHHVHYNNSDEKPSSWKSSNGDSSPPRPAFQRPVNPNSALIANGWIEQQRRSRMRTTWKVVLASVVEGRKAGEETTLWIQREIANNGKRELQALHQIPIKLLHQVTYLDYASDGRFTLRIHNATEVFLFRCNDEEAAQNWVWTLRKAQGGNKSAKKSSRGAASPLDEWDQTNSKEIDRKNVEDERRVQIERERLRQLEEERRRKLAEEERRRQLEEERRRQIEAEHRRKMEEEHRRKLEEERRRQIEEDHKRQLEAERRRKLEEEHRQKLEQQRVRLEEERRRSLEEHRRKLEADRKRQLEEDAAQRRWLADQAKQKEAVRQQQQEAVRLQQQEAVRLQQWQQQQWQQKQQAEAEQRRQHEEAIRQQQWQQWQRHQHQQQQYHQHAYQQHQQQQKPVYPNHHSHQGHTPQPHTPCHGHQGVHGHQPAPRSAGTPHPAPHSAGMPGSAPHSGGVPPSAQQAPPPGPSQQRFGNQDSPVNMKYAQMCHATEDVTAGQVTEAALKHSILVEWALQPPSWQILRPIDTLVTTIHQVFPPKFGVPTHAYFNKWKPLSSDDTGILGRPDEDKLKKSIRKIRFFLHPDKLPRDLTEHQKFMCKMLWDIVSDAWEEYIKRKEDMEWTK